MEEFKILKGNRENLPSELDLGTMYIATSDTENNYSSIFVAGKEWVSKEYIDLRIGEIEKLLSEL